jgi:hypothetical protein
MDLSRETAAQAHPAAFHNRVKGGGRDGIGMGKGRVREGTIYLFHI